MNENTQATLTPTVSIPRFWVGILFAVLPFVLILVIPTPTDYKHVEEVHLYYDKAADRVVQVSKDITPSHPYALYAAAFVVLGWAYWLYCVYRVHKVMAEATNGAHSIPPNKAALFHLIPLYNLYWVFKWTREIAKSVHNHSNRFMQGGMHGTFLLVALLIVYTGLMPPSAVLAHAIALAIAVLVGINLSRHVRARAMQADHAEQKKHRGEVAAPGALSSRRRPSTRQSIVFQEEDFAAIERRRRPSMGQSNVLCKGCGVTLPELQVNEKLGNPKYSQWCREGYCSFPCFEKNKQEGTIGCNTSGLTT